MYENKYYKYKLKYLKRKSKLNQTGGAAPTHILLDGTSSSGKTVISNCFVGHGYKHISIDDYADVAYVAFIAQLPNEYISKDVKEKEDFLFMYKYMVSESKKYDSVVFDVVDQSIVEHIGRDNVYIIIVYASLEKLVRNMYNRKSVEPRGEGVFIQFSDRYIATDNVSESVGSVNLKKFIASLKSKLKYLFESEEALITFATDIFKKMDIDDDKKHYVKLRDTYQYDYILKTHKKQPSELCDELETVLKLTGEK
jgi:GTPase SAR1 family protein